MRGGVLGPMPREGWWWEKKEEVGEERGGKQCWAEGTVELSAGAPKILGSPNAGARMVPRVTQVGIRWPGLMPISH
jgi:hypothetical protein